MDNQEERETRKDIDLESERAVGTGRKVGIYAIGFIILAIIFLTILTLSGVVKNPFEAAPGIGP